MQITRAWLKRNYPGDQMHITRLLKEFGEKFPEGATFLETAKWLHRLSRMRGHVWLQELFKMALKKIGKRKIVGLAYSWAQSTLPKIDNPHDKKAAEKALSHVRDYARGKKINLPTVSGDLSVVDNSILLEYSESCPSLYYFCFKAVSDAIRSVAFASTKGHRLLNDVVFYAVGAAFSAAETHKNKGKFRRRLIRDIVEAIGETQ